MEQEQDITADLVKSGLLDGIHVNHQDSSLSIPPFRELKSKKITFKLPEASPLNFEIGKNSVSQQILSIIFSKSVRKGKKSLLEPFQDLIVESIENSVSHNQPISFVLPTLPFKDQSPFVTGAGIDHVDLGEYAFFAQLKRILSAIKKVYPPGAHMTLLCDGFIYADIFASGDKDGAGKYKARCEKIKNDYGLYNEVTLFDMREVLFDMPEYVKVEAKIQDLVRELYKSDLLVKERLDFLAKRFIFHVDLPGVSYEQARIMYTDGSWLSLAWDQLLESAIRYSSLQLTMKKTGLVKRAFPSAIRCTVHPKAAPQLPLHLTNQHNKLLPYNGVATISRQEQDKNKSLFDSLRIKRLCDVFQYDDVVAVWAENLDLENPIYYEIP